MEELLEPISKNGFWFKVRAAANIKPEVPAKPTPIVVNTPVLRGFAMSAQRRVWANQASLKATPDMKTFSR
jgi:hypothetical protein